MGIKEIMFIKVIFMLSEIWIDYSERICFFYLGLILFLIFFYIRFREKVIFERRILIVFLINYEEGGESVFVLGLIKFIKGW